ncbi:MAG: ATP-dependent helicase DeaD [Patescibacteria group bacterium]|nr:ATP-dependent helicase DeaD [Patescibacteria group bacterium]
MYQGNRNSRPRFGGGSRPVRPNNNFRGRGGFGGGRREVKSTLDISKLINKVSITEVAEVYIADNNFSDFLVDERLKNNILAKGYVSPTPIQDKIIPHILQGSDVVGIANTGTGKTAAFAIPLLDKILRDPKEKVLIMAPTRELAIQIETELKSFATRLGVHSVVCVGGAPIGRQIADLRHPNQFVIGTPGRLKDLIERRVLNLSGFATVVLDEADRMLDMGFINDMRYIIGLMQKERHTFFFPRLCRTRLTS